MLQFTLETWQGSKTSSAGCPRPSCTCTSKGPFCRTLIELSTRHDARPLTLAEAEAHLRFDDFTGFIEGFKAVTRRLIDPEDYELVAWRMMQHLAEQGVVHAEVYISVGVIYMWRNFDPRALEPIFAGLERARERAESELGLTLYWIFDAVRHFTVEEAERVFRKAAELRPRYPFHHRHRTWRRRAPAPVRSRSTLLYGSARAGLRLTNHAGETTGPEAIREALAIGSERIGHALSAIQDADSSRIEDQEDRPGTEPDFECPHRSLRVVCRSSAAALFRRWPAGHSQLR